MFEASKKLLTRIYQDAKVGSLGSTKVLEKCKNPDFKKLIENQKNSYDKIIIKCRELAKLNEINLHDINFFKKIRQTTMINFSLFIDDSDRHIAEIMITGTVMGIIDALKSLYDLEKANHKVVELGQELKSLQEKYVEDLKVFLREN